MISVKIIVLHVYCTMLTGIM